MALASGPRAHPGSPVLEPTLALPFGGRDGGAGPLASPARAARCERGVGSQPLGPQPPCVRPGRGRGRLGDVTSGVHSRSGRCAGGRGASQVRSGHEQALPGSGWRAGGLTHRGAGGRWAAAGAGDWMSSRGVAPARGLRAQGRRLPPLACPLWRTPGSGGAGWADGSLERPRVSCLGLGARPGPRGYGT